MSEFFNQLFRQLELPLSNPVLIFSLLLFIILLAPILLRRLKIPGIIGLILSGVVVGPFGFNFLANNSAIDLFSTIGLLYIMFIAGLDLEMNDFKKTRNKSILFGFLTFILPLSIGFPFCYFILGYGFNASMLIASMFSTHTLVSYPIVSKLGISKNQAVAVTVGGTILTDTAVLIILAVIIGNNEGTLDQAFWIKLGVSLAAFSVIMFFFIPKITKWFFSKLESEKHAHYIFVLSVVFFAAFLAEIAGVEPIIGAFVAGLALNTLIPKSSALMNRIEFIGNSLFIPFFLISVGMLVDLSVIFKGPMAIVIAISLTIIAIFGKWLAALFTQLIFKYSKAQRKLIFGLSSSHAAATLAVILVGYKAGILDENILNGTIILILITCIVASFATDKAAKQILLSEESNELSEGEIELINSEHILLPISNLMNIEKLLEFTLLIKDKKSLNPVTILSVVPNNNEAELNIISARNKLEKFKMQGAASEVRVKTIATIDYNIASGINRISREIMADIIVLGWPRKAGILDIVIGEKIYSIIENNDKNLFICSFKNHLINQKRIVVISPPLAEKEDGFETWIQKISKLSSELSVQIIHFGTEGTQESMKEVIKQKKLNSPILYNKFNDWEDFGLMSGNINEGDLIILISARKNSVSYTHYQDRLTSRIEKQFVNNNKIVIFPRQFTSSQTI
ncbi:MAG TPA: sodium:proton antiporter [Rikenellaceae bacterium]|nr:sodium:proton antiporter [Rikenellaceae bacterium]